MQQLALTTLASTRYPNNAGSETKNITQCSYLLKRKFLAIITALETEC